MCRDGDGVMGEESEEVDRGFKKMAWLQLYF